MRLFNKLPTAVQADIVTFLNVAFWIIFVGVYLMLTISDAR